MSIVAYTQQNEFDLVNSGQDCLGWTVVDQAGNNLGEVKEMLIETDEMRVDSIIVKGVRIPAENIALRDGKVVVRGVMDDEKYTATQAAATTTASATRSYDPAPRNTGAKHVAGVTREAGDDEISIPIIEEQLTIGKRTVEKGGINVRTTMTENPVEETVNLREENVTVERHKVDRPVEGSTAFQEGSFDVTTRAEIPVVDKEARVVEDVVIDKEMIERTETVRETVKRTDVEVDEINTVDAATRKND